MGVAVNKCTASFAPSHTKAIYTLGIVRPIQGNEVRLASYFYPKSNQRLQEYRLFLINSTSIQLSIIHGCRQKYMMTNGKHFVSGRCGRGMRRSQGTDNMSNEEIIKEVRTKSGMAGQSTEVEDKNKGTK